MLFYITIYLGIGWFIMFTMQYINHKFIPEDIRIYFNILETILGIIFWPILIIVFIKAYKNPPKD